MSRFLALVAAELSPEQYGLSLVERSIDALPPGDILIRVEYTSLNYKDALSATGNKGVTRHYPHTPGIDATGTVVQSNSETIQVGETVIVTGFDLGMNTPGGFGGYIRVPHRWVLPCPPGLSSFKSMVYGTAGLTAALCIHKLQQHDIFPEQGSILVTGATGGVGSLAVALLAQLGYHVTAVTGKSQAMPYLTELGAAQGVSRSQWDDHSGKPLLKGQYAGAIDTVGGNILATVIKSLQYGGVVTACGLVMAPELHTTVYPFILRGISLLGIDSAECPLALRTILWQKLATQWQLENWQ
ncbi:MAG TPA: YhdH/YhfP family quinone oxidoreductase, partial [Allocoleopsis sp.]